METRGLSGTEIMWWVVELGSKRDEKLALLLLCQCPTHGQIYHMKVSIYCLESRGFFSVASGSILILEKRLGHGFVIARVTFLSCV